MFGGVVKGSGVPGVSVCAVFGTVWGVCAGWPKGSRLGSGECAG